MNARKKILILDDQINYLDTIFTIFKENNCEYEILKTTKPQTALMIAEEEKPDLIITDWEMPDISGIELIKCLKAKGDTCDIPVIMSTGVMTNPEHLETALMAGANDYIRKPIDPVELIARTQSILKITDYQKQLLEQKNKELVENSMYLVQNNEFILKMVGNIEEIMDHISDKPEALELSEKVLDTINNKVREDSWQRFEIYFQRVYADFQKNLTRQFPNLTKTELRLATFLRLGMSSKDIAAATFQTLDSIKVGRSRLRKKIKLEQSVDLTTFLSGF